MPVELAVFSADCAAHEPRAQVNSRLTSGKYLDAEPTGERVVVHEMMFNSVVDGRIAETWAMTAGPGFYEQITGREAPEALDNLG